MNSNPIKYPSTPHLPFSQGLQRDDTRITTLDYLNGREVVVTEKMDGENCLDENTVIETQIGPKTIEEICESNNEYMALSYDISANKNIFNPIIQTRILEESDDWYEIVTECGQVLTVTGNHLIWAENKKKYIKVSDLIGDEILRISS